jgi:hypothetical protein
MKVSNIAQASQRLTQQLPGPGGFLYTFSIFVRSDAPSSLDLIRASGATESRLTIHVSGTWTRFECSGALATAGDGIDVAVELAAGVSVYLYGAQLEAQPAAGGYKKKTDRSGVYSSARFDQDALAGSATAPGQFSTKLQVTSPTS